MSQPAGTALAVLASLDHPDQEGDLIVTGALVNGPDDLAVVSRADHSVILDGEEPVGQARVYEKDGRLWAQITLTTRTPTMGHSSTCETARRTRPTYSVGYRVLKSREPTTAERARGVKRVILRWQILEVSATARPAGVGTGLMEVSCA